MHDMSDATTSVSEQVAKLIAEVLATIASQRAHLKDGRPELFPEGIGDIHVALTVPGGVSIEIDIASSPRKEERFSKPAGPDMSAHPMDITLHGNTDMYAKFSEQPSGPPSAEYKLKVGQTTHIPPP
jgi:hypothetical protein